MPRHLGIHVLFQVMVNRPKFDLILANPPYEPDVPAEICKESPTTCTNLATGGGVSGEDINAAIVIPALRCMNAV